MIFLVENHHLVPYNKDSNATQISKIFWKQGTFFFKGWTSCSHSWKSWWKRLHWHLCLPWLVNDCCKQIIREKILLIQRIFIYLKDYFNILAYAMWFKWFGRSCVVTGREVSCCLGKFRQLLPFYFLNNWSRSRQIFRVRWNAGYKSSAMVANQSIACSGKLRWESTAH